MTRITVAQGVTDPDGIWPETRVLGDNLHRMQERISSLEAELVLSQKTAESEATRAEKAEAEVERLTKEGPPEFNILVICDHCGRTQIKHVVNTKQSLRYGPPYVNGKKEV